MPDLATVSNLLGDLLDTGVASVDVAPIDFSAMHYGIFDNESHTIFFNHKGNGLLHETIAALHQDPLLAEYARGDDILPELSGCYNDQLENLDTSPGCAC